MTQDKQLEASIKVAAEKHATHNYNDTWYTSDEQKKCFIAGAQSDAAKQYWYEQFTLEHKQVSADRACPCLYLDEPCHERCTCRNGSGSVGCQYCCTYGSLEQRKERAIEIKNIFKQTQHPQQPTLEAISAMAEKEYVMPKELDAYNWDENIIVERERKAFIKGFTSALGYSAGESPIKDSRS